MRSQREKSKAARGAKATEQAKKLPCWHHNHHHHTNGPACIHGDKCRFLHHPLLSRADFEKLPIPKKRDPSRPPLENQRGRDKKKGDEAPGARSKSASRAGFKYCFTFYKKGECNNPDCKFKEFHIPKKEVDRRINEEREAKKKKKKGDATAPGGDG